MATHRPASSRADSDYSISHLDDGQSVRESKKRASSRVVQHSANDGTTAIVGGTEYAQARPWYPLDTEQGGKHDILPVETARDLVTEVLHVEDDPTLNPWTFRVWFTGLGLSCFGGALATIYQFKPQTVAVSAVFLAVVGYVIGEFLALTIPRRGLIGRWLNPHPFNQKEHAAIVIMAASAANAPIAVEVLAVQKLWYGQAPNAGVGILLMISSQCLGYGIAGLLRSILVHPTKMLYPINLPLNTLLETLHRDKDETKRQLRVFYIAFFMLFFWEMLPQYVMPVLIGISFFCLAKRDSLVFTNIFGGTNGNEGLGFLSICLDWQYIVGSASPMWLPLQTLNNNLVGYLLCIVVFSGVFYGNVWSSRDFPFLSQLLFTAESNGTAYVRYNQSEILGPGNTVLPDLVQQQGLPWFTGTWLTYLLCSNLAITATFTHMLLWNYDDLKSAWSFTSWSRIRSLLSWKSTSWRFWQDDDKDAPSVASEDMDLDPHYRLMLAYKDAPSWWYATVLLFSVAVGLTCCYLANSSLPWYGFLVACLLSAVCILFFGAQYAITGFQFIIQPVMQLIGGYMHPGKPVANMYFVLFGYNSVVQGQLLLRDLKFAQYAHLSPRCTFTMQMTGTLVGAILSYIMMDSITTNQREILLSIEGTNIWSGQAVQSFNSQAIAWGGLAKEMFSAGSRYDWVAYAFLIGFTLPVPFWLGHRYFPKLRLDHWNTAILAYFTGWLCVGINSSVLSYFIVGYTSQWYLRVRKPAWFRKYNYILSAAMDGGTQVLVFILTFAVFGASGKEVPFPPYWGNGFGGERNFDYCMQNPGTSGRP
ncbi:hypothetical protein MBLNU230_g2891t1 [Neophaeotheca triangularis]